MFSHTLAVLVGYVALALAREPVRPMPTITNSLVNLGKMEVAFYLSGNGRDGPSHAIKRDHDPLFPSPFFPKLETVIEEPCLCSSIRNAKDNFMTNPTSLINKILSQSDLFSNPNDPVKSTICCDSQEHMHDSSVYFEFSPKQSIKPVKPSELRSRPLPMMPFILDSFLPRKSILPGITKSKQIEVFLYPNKKDMTTVVGNFEKFDLGSKKKHSQKLQKDIHTLPKEAITVVGDKKLENNIDLFKPPPPVKKDLSAQIKKDTENAKPENAKPVNEKPEKEGNTIMLTTGKLNSI